jgi:hypothetical protein
LWSPPADPSSVGDERGHWQGNDGLRRRPERRRRRGQVPDSDTLHNNGNVTFDNRITNANTDMDTAYPQTIAGGSIVIHRA